MAQRFSLFLDVSVEGKGPKGKIMAIHVISEVEDPRKSRSREQFLIPCPVLTHPGEQEADSFFNGGMINISAMEEGDERPGGL